MKQILLAVILFSHSLLSGAVEIMPLNEVRPGMRGTGLTIFENNQIEQFDVEIIDVVKNYFPHRDLILVRLLGDKVDHTGVVAGMSGSPIYINNKLIGALAYRMGDFMKDPIAGVTPIEEMLDIFSKEKVRDQELSATAHNLPGYLNNYFVSSDPGEFDLFKMLTIHQNPGLNGIKPIEIPLIVTGLAPAVYKQVDHYFQQSNFILMPGGKIDPQREPPNAGLQAGAAVAAVIISGDFNLSALGTVTYRDGNKILAFGHPFYNKGPVNIPLAEANVITTLSSLYASNKFAIATNIIGNMRQDRSTGIMGLIGETPPLIPVHARVKSSMTAEKTYLFNVVNDRTLADMIPVYLWITLLNALESARLGNGDYSLILKGKIELENSHQVRLDNFYSGGSAGSFSGAGLDIAEAAFDIVMTLGALLSNNFEPPKVTGIDLEFFAQPGKKLAEVEKVFYDREEVAPGDPLNVVIFLRPYQGKIIELTRKITIPANVRPGYVTIAVGGAGDITRWEYQSGINRFMPANFDELVSLLNRKRQNKDIIIQLRVKDDGAILHGREFPTLPPSIFHQLKDKKIQRQRIYESVTERIVKEWSIPLDFEVRGGRKFNVKIKER